MTRINLVPVQALSLQHLIAEYREAPRIYDYVLKHGVDKSRIPEEYTLGKGHVLFFTDKLDFVYIRILACWEELQRRKCGTTYHPNDILTKYINILDADGQIVWKPSTKEINISAQRIYQKIALKPNFYTYYKKGD